MMELILLSLFKMIKKVRFLMLAIFSGYKLFVEQKDSAFPDGHLSF